MTMKSMILSTFALLMLSTQSFATEYKCIASSLQATNSDIFYELSNSDIDQLLKDGNFFAVRANETCEINAREYRCIADSLEAYNSDIFYNLSQSEVQAMLNDPNSYGYYYATNAAKNCKFKR